MFKLKKSAAPAPAPAPAAAAAAASSSSGAGSTSESGAAAASASSASPAPAPAAAGISIIGVGRGGKSRAGGAKKVSAAERRIQNDIAELDAGKVAEVDWPDKRNLMLFNVTVKADSGLWKDATYVFEVTVPKAYPHEPPKARCVTPIYHPNIDWEGAVCLNILRKDWKPVLDMNAVIYGLIMLFYEPNANDPLNHEVADELRGDRASFERNVARSLTGSTVRGRRFPRLR